MPVAGKPLVTYSLSVFEACAGIREIVLTVARSEIEQASAIVRDYGFSKVISIVPGGKVRQESVRNGLRSVSPGMEIVAIHDGARPLVTEDIITASIKAAAGEGAAVAAVPVVDTIKSSPDSRRVGATLEREQLYSIQTPQTFKREIIEAAYERAYAEHFFGTDDASLVERLGLPVALVPGSYENIKVTTPSDLVVAEAIIRRRQGKAPAGAGIRVGHGYDVHRFGPGRKLYLGGVEFKGEEGLVGHSDADVLLHAVMDAVLGAAGAGDIGSRFPDTDPAYKDIRSTRLLEEVQRIVTDLGWQVGNVDVTLVAEGPRIAKHAPDMRANIAHSLGISPEQVSVKASTAEGLGPIGQGLGIECHAVAVVCPL